MFLENDKAQISAIQLDKLHETTQTQPQPCQKQQQHQQSTQARPVQVIQLYVIYIHVRKDQYILEIAVQFTERATIH